MNLALNHPSMLSGKVSDYNDIAGLESLKFDKRDQAERIDEVSRQFESMYVSMMLKGMRSANKVFSEGNPLNSQQTEFYQDMYDSQLAVSLSSSKGLGLASVIKEQLMQRYNLTESGAKSTSMDGANPGYSLESYLRNPVKTAQSRQALESTMTEVDLQLALNAPQLETAMPRMNQVDAAQLNGPDSFIEQLYPLAKKVEVETGIDARLMLAQSALETGWGQHQIMTEEGQPSFNLFGIKAQRDWGGPHTEITTTEYREGVPLKERAQFRVYPSFEESFRDYAAFLQSHDRYQNALDQREDPVAFAHALQASGYATDPQYGNKIEQIVDRYFVAPSAQSGTHAQDAYPRTGGE